MFTGVIFVLTKNYTRLKTYKVVRFGICKKGAGFPTPKLTYL